MNLQKEKGFTLVELLIVSILIGILATIAISRIDFSTSKNKLKTSTSGVTSSMYMARMKAVNDGEMCGVQFLESGEFYVTKDPLGVNPVIGSSFLEEGISFGEITFVDWFVRFDAMGQLEKSCLSGGELAGTIFLHNDIGDTTRVDVTYITGRIRETNL